MCIATLVFENKQLINYGTFLTHAASYNHHVCLSLPQEQLPGYIQDLVEFRLLLFAANGLPSFSTRVAVSG